MLRFFFIIALLAKYFFIYLLLKFGLYKKPKQKILRNFFEEAGGSFIKFGQLLALKIDVLPVQYALELVDLFDNVKPFSYKDVERTFLEELGATPQKIFKDFQKIPFASASFGQVHGAKLENGHIVAVKVLRPGIEDKLNIDFIIIDILAFFADLFLKIEALPWKEFAQEFKKWTKNELDYQIEAENMKKIYKNASVNKNVVIPNVYPHLSSKKILVQDYIEGIPLSRVLRGLRDGRLSPEKLEKRGIDIRKILSVYTQEFLRQALIDDLFHADPHPGNILILKDNKVALLDFGIIGESLTYNKTSFIKFLKSMTQQDRKGAIYHFANLTSEDLKNMIGSALPASLSLERLEKIWKLLANHFSETVSRISSENAQPIKDAKKDWVTGFLQVVKSAQKYRVKLPKQAALLMRTLSIGGILAKQLNHEFTLIEEVKKFFDAHPEETILDREDYSPPFKRINREKAIEKLNSWLSYLVEVDPTLYQLVKDKFKEYNSVDS